MSLQSITLRVGFAGRYVGDRRRRGRNDVILGRRLEGLKTVLCEKSEHGRRTTPTSAGTVRIPWSRQSSGSGVPESDRVSQYVFCRDTGARTPMTTGWQRISPPAFCPRLPRRTNQRCIHSAARSSRRTCTARRGGRRQGTGRGALLMAESWDGILGARGRPAVISGSRGHDGRQERHSVAATSVPLSETFCKCGAAAGAAGA